MKERKIKMLKKQMFAAGMCTVLAFTTAVPTFAQETNASKTAEANAEYEKKESVYARLQADGTSDDAYVVNHFSVSRAGKITDYGTYEDIKNLTNLESIATKNQQTDFDADKGEFYYQGTVKNVQLPWLFHITYELDGKAISAEKLGGKSGALKIGISMEKNLNAEESFFDNYVTQISLTLDDEKAKNIKADGATIADAGANTQLSFTVLPGKDAEYTVEADVTDFSMSGFSIAAVPYSMDIDLSDYNVDDMTGQFDELIEATEELNDGMEKLSSGMKELDGNSGTLLNGFAELKNGIGTLDENASDLISGSAQIKKALSAISDSLGQADFSALGSLQELPASVDQLSSGLKNLKGGLTQLKQGFDQSYAALDQAMQGASSVTLSQDELTALGAKAATDEESGVSIQKLLTAYGNLQKILGTWEAVKPAFLAVSTSLDENNTSSVISGLNAVIGGLDQMSSSLSTSLQDVDIESQMSSLSSGLKQLSNSYTSFHSGLSAYMNGISSLYDGASKYQSGLSKYLGGIGDTADGSVSLKDGMQKYTDGVSEIPQTMQDKIDEMMEQYTSSDYDAVSFTDSRNENVESVQFVISTQEITEPKVEKKQETEAKTGFFDRLKALFQKN